MVKVILKLQHLLNPLHIYCRLRDLGLSPELASRICSVYERSFYHRKT